MSCLVHVCQVGTQRLTDRFDALHCEREEGAQGPDPGHRFAPPDPPFPPAWGLPHVCAPSSPPHAPLRARAPRSAALVPLRPRWGAGSWGGCLGPNIRGPSQVASHPGVPGQPHSPVAASFFPVTSGPQGQPGGQSTAPAFLGAARGTPGAAVKTETVQRGTHTWALKGPLSPGMAASQGHVTLAKPLLSFPFACPGCRGVGAGAPKRGAPPSRSGRSESRSHAPRAFPAASPPRDGGQVPTVFFHLGNRGSPPEPTGCDATR